VGTAVISYRLSPQVKHPGHIEDVARAFAWVHAHIGELGGLNDRIFISGQSAGGHLCALLATNESYLQAQGHSLSDIRGAIPISGIFEFKPGQFNPVIGPGAEAARSASPIHFLSDRCPPCLVLYAERDIPDCDRMSARMCRELQDLGVSAAVQEIKGRNHISIIFRLMLSTRDPATQDMLRFIAENSELQLTEHPR